MSARRKLNAAHLLGTLTVAGLVGAVTGSVTAFTVAFVGLAYRRPDRPRHPLRQSVGGPGRRPRLLVKLDHPSSGRSAFFYISLRSE